MGEAGWEAGQGPAGKPRLWARQSRGVGPAETDIEQAALKCSCCSSLPDALGEAGHRGQWDHPAVG